jgi:hypothetical protein
MPTIAVMATSGTPIIISIVFVVSASRIVVG